MVVRELRANGPVAVLFLYVRGFAKELVARGIILEHRGVAAGIGCSKIHNRVVAEGRHAGRLDSNDLVIFHFDFGVAVSLGVGECERA